MRLPHINWTKIAENLAAADPYAYAAVLMADGSIQTGEGQTLVGPSESPETVDQRARHESWCRRAGRAAHTAPAVG
jgi:hypothetical protein